MQSEGKNKLNHYAVYLKLTQYCKSTVHHQQQQKISRQQNFLYNSWPNRTKSFKKVMKNVKIKKKKKTIQTLASPLIQIQVP